MGLARFVIARIAELEAKARAASDGPWELVDRRDEGNDIEIAAGDGTYVAQTSYDDVSTTTANSLADAEHIAAWSPERVLAMCAAVRAVAEAWRAAEAEAGFVGEMRSVGTAEGLEEAMMLLARPFAGHPDFDPAWRVE